MKFPDIPFIVAMGWVLKPTAKILFFCTVTGSATGASWPNENDVLWALRQVETGDQWDKIGAAGELGAYQLRESTWCEYSTAPFAYAADPILGEVVARVHLRKVVKLIEAKGELPTPRKIARAWNPRAPKDYAQRVENLVRDREGKR